MDEFVGGDLLGHLDEVFDTDMRLSFDLDFDMKDSFSNGIGSTDDWNTWGSLRSSPAFDVLGEKDGCVMVSPESVMPFVTREMKQKPPIPTPVTITPRDRINSIPNGFLLERATEDKTEIKLEAPDTYEEEEEEDNEEELDEEEIEEEEDDNEEYEEEEHIEEVKLQPKDKRIWNNILSHAALRTDNSSSQSYSGRQKTEIVVAKSPSLNVPTSFIPKTPSNVVPSQTLKVIHATKKSNSTDSSPVTSHSRSLLVNRRYKDSDGYPKPAYSYSCLIAMALKNSNTGSLPVSEIYNFMCEHFPYFKSAPSGWKNSVRHNLSLNKCFEKIEKGNGGSGCRKGCLWAMNPTKVAKMDDEVAKWSKKDPSAIRRAMKNPEELERLERGDLKIGMRRESADSGAEEDESDSSSGSGSDSDTEEVPPSLKRFDSRLSSQESNDLGLPDEMYEELGYLEEVMSSDTEIDLTPEVKRVRLGLESHPRQHVRPV